MRYKTSQTYQKLTGYHISSYLQYSFFRYIPAVIRKWLSHKSINLYTIIYHNISSPHRTCFQIQCPGTITRFRTVVRARQHLFFNIRSSASHCHGTRSQNFGDHIQLWTSLHGDTKPWLSRLFLSPDYLKSSALPEGLCVSWMASCVPLCSHVLKTFSNVKTLLRLHYLLQGSCQWFSSGSWHMRASS